MRTTYPRVAEEGDNDGYGVGTLYPGRAPSRYARLSMDLTLQCAAGPDRWQPTCEPSKELRRWGGPKCAAITPRPNPCEPPLTAECHYWRTFTTRDHVYTGSLAGSRTSITTAAAAPASAAKPPSNENYTKRSGRLYTKPWTRHRQQHTHKPTHATTGTTVGPAPSTHATSGTTVGPGPSTYATAGTTVGPGSSTYATAGTTVGPQHPVSAIFHSTEASPVSKTAHNQPTEVSLVADPACSVPNKQDRRVGTERSCNHWHQCRPTTPHLSHFSLNRGVTGFKDRAQPTNRGVIGCRSRL